MSDRPWRDPRRDPREAPGDDPGVPEYRIGAVAKALGLGQYTLKHYERAGLIEPHASESGYRYYTCSEVGQLIIIRSLRRMGFSVEEVGELLAKGPAETLAAYRGKLDENRRRIRELEEADAMLARRVGALEDYVARGEGPGGACLRRIPRFQFVEHFKNEQMNEAVSELAASALWQESYERAHVAMRFPAESVAGEGDEYWWGLVLFNEELDELRAIDPARGPASEAAGATGGEAGLTGSAAASALAAPATPRSGFGCVRRVEAHKALVMGATLEREGTLAGVRALVREALTARGLSLAGDVYALSESQERLPGGGVEQSLTIIVPAVPAAPSAPTAPSAPDEP